MLRKGNKEIAILIVFLLEMFFCSASKITFIIIFLSVVVRLDEKKNWKICEQNGLKKGGQVFVCERHISTFIRWKMPSNFYIRSLYMSIAHSQRNEKQWKQQPKKEAYEKLGMSSTECYIFFDTFPFGEGEQCSVLWKNMYAWIWFIEKKRHFLSYTISPIHLQ